MRHNNKAQKYTKLCRFCIFPGNGLALLGIQDIKCLHILAIECNTIELRQKVKRMRLWQKRNATETKLQIVIHVSKIAITTF